MLVLSRKKNETLIIDPRSCPVDEQGLITVCVVDIRGDKVRLGVEAPKPVAVHRKEVWDAIERKKTKGEPDAA